MFYNFAGGNSYDMMLDKEEFKTLVMLYGANEVENKCSVMVEQIVRGKKRMLK